MEEYSPGGVCEAKRERVVEDAAEPGVRVEGEHVDVGVRAGEGGGVRGERGVVVEDVLLVERGVGGAEVARGAFEWGDVEEKVCPAEVVVVCVRLCVTVRRGHIETRWIVEGTYYGTEERLHLGFPERFKVKLDNDVTRTEGQGWSMHLEN